MRKPREVSDGWVKDELAAQPKRHERSGEAEARDILRRAAYQPHIGLALLEAAQQMGGIDDLVVPKRKDLAPAAKFE